MRNIEAKELKIKFIESLSELSDFSYEEGNPFLVRIGANEYFVFLKNISSAHFPKSPDVTRAQLPFSDRFTKIVEANNIPFVILGYDTDNDVFVSWNPDKVKERLNGKSNVSLYSRETLQSSVLSSEFKEGYLSTGEKILLFKSSNLSKCFNDFSQFSWQKKGKKLKLVEDPLLSYSSSKLTEIENIELLNEITPLLLQNKILKAAEIVSDFYGNEYRNMTLKDWFNLLNKQYLKIKL